MPSTKLSDLEPDVQAMFEATVAACKAIGITVVVTCTLRSIAEQTALYAQGRNTLAEVNRLRKIAGLYALADSENKNCVTWTMHSKHLPNANGKSIAVDFAISDGKKISWDIKADVNHDNRADYIQVAEIAVKNGLEAGAFWTTAKDYPHLQRKSA